MSSKLPEGWLGHRLGDILEISNDGISADAIAELAAVAHYSLPAFDDGRVPEITAGLNIKSNKSLVPPDCVLFGKLNPRIPRVWRVAERSQLPSVCSTEFWPLVARSDEIDLDFLTAFIGSEAFLSDPQITPSSSTNSHQRVDRRSFENYVLPLPSLDEQRRIAEVLRSADEAILWSKATVEQSLRCLESTLATLMNGSDVNEEEWSEGRCDNFFVLQRGFDITESQATPGPYRVISSSGPSYTHEKAAIAAPAVITGRKGRLGAVFYSEHPCWPHDTTLWVKDFKGNNPRFVFWKLKAMKLETFDAATSVPTLNRNNVHALHVRFPSVRQQVEISEILDAQHRALLDQQGEVRALETVTVRLASDLLSGRVRVPA
ncbi:restriction endonuclease subunit S [Aureimonas jatrophae]|uniref:Type I restriction modification DNA specificity domain-containing protein n=1 Tax=Aureimonas jatrophae TaxID=1166073 RepID=A0A1H0NIM9_9HYPH|nr:restriction endonuclease subunit S [Aureimonas jatrophae]MBB3953074.1 hypothetical protein [Aureimonas jatrophae]SDO92265.1 Type I restriction modification DNA specificity domain-containing protein [Aureimonas jatrophae]